jgi:fatty acid desaturase
MVVMQKSTHSPRKHAFDHTVGAGIDVAPVLKESRNGIPNTFEKETSVMLWTILVILLVLWLVGLLSHVGGSLIHLLLVVAVVVLIINLVTGRRAV